MSSSAPLPSYKNSFLDTCLSSSILKFGTFTLKSGRQSPYFFNTALFHTATLSLALSTAYAQTLVHSPSLSFDLIFGPAYKGIPLCATVVERLGQLDARYADVGYAFDRKEKKDHGEGGVLVGMPLRGKKVLIIDDVVTAGTAKREAIETIRREGGEVVGIIVALDRQEKLPKGAGGSTEDEEGERESAIGQLRAEYGIPILSVLTLDDLVGGLKNKGMTQEMEACEEYRRRWRASDAPQGSGDKEKALQDTQLTSAASHEGAPNHPQPTSGTKEALQQSGSDPTPGPEPIQTPSKK